MTLTETCPFDVGDEVAILDGLGGKALTITRVSKIASKDGYVHPEDSRHRVFTEGAGHGFVGDHFGYSRQSARSPRQYLVPATAKHRDDVRRAELIAKILRCKPILPRLTTASLERIADALDRNLSDYPIEAGVISYTSDDGMLFRKPEEAAARNRWLEEHAREYEAQGARA